MNDFYYSKKQDDLCKSMDMIDVEKSFVCRFKGRVFSEQMASGSGGSNWDDAIFLGTGTDADCTYS